MQYFYTDPLKAAVMVRDFRVKLRSDEYEPVFINDLIFDFLRSEESGSKSKLAPFIIVDESLPLFQPMDGDIDCCGYTFDGEMQCWRKFCDDPELGAVYFTVLSCKSETYIRNGKQFFTPEQG